MVETSAGTILVIGGGVFLTGMIVALVLILVVLGRR
jgi:hypothetical protein